MSKRKPRITLRTHRPGDLGWVVQAHGRLYHREYGWGPRFEAMVAGIAEKFLERYDPSWERCWIAEMGGEPVGSAVVVRDSRTRAKLRLLLIDPKARGCGLGKRLVARCVRFARAKGYRSLVLWTQSDLLAARHIYEAAGFKRIRTEPHSDFGVRLTGEYWKLELGR